MRVLIWSLRFLFSWSKQRERQTLERESRLYGHLVNVTGPRRKFLEEREENEEENEEEEKEEAKRNGGRKKEEKSEEKRLPKDQKRQKNWKRDEGNKNDATVRNVESKLRSWLNHALLTSQGILSLHCKDKINSIHLFSSA